MLSPPCEDTARRWLPDCMPRRGPSLGTESVGTLVLDIPASRLWENICLFCKSLGLLYFDMAAKQTKTHLSPLFHCLSPCRSSNTDIWSSPHSLQTKQGQDSYRIREGRRGCSSFCWQSEQESLSSSDLATPFLGIYLTYIHIFQETLLKLCAAK